ncbi:restriction endonuclease subunit S [Peptostreptococcus stomatis]|uniref:restriction endonuclease subunit S n=1 Tax=Peptostreptococcus stomatis TaxID=341694 RepID=UPI0039918C46
MTEWIECSIGDLCNTISDTYKGNDEYVVLVNTSDVLEGKVLNHEPVVNKNLKGQFKKTFKKNDILYSEIRPANKRFAYIDFENTSNYIASTKLMVLRHNDKVLPEYLFALVKSNYVIAELQHLAETRSGTFPQITFSSELAPMKVLLPDKDTQKRIVSVLSNIELKIDENIAINNNLEQQVYAVYQAWFEDFNRFDGICPQTWKKGILANIASITSGKRPPMKSIDKTEEAIIPLVGAASVMGYTSEANHVDRILVTGRVGTHGTIQRFNIPCWTSDNTLVITSDLYEYTYQILQRIDYHSMNRGSTQPLITQGDMNKTAILLPDKEILNEFESLAGQLMAQVEANIQENSKMAELRDTLLSKLMSGELDVSDIDF